MSFISQLAEFQLRAMKKGNPRVWNRTKVQQGAARFQYRDPYACGEPRLNCEQDKLVEGDNSQWMVV